MNRKKGIQRPLYPHPALLTAICAASAILLVQSFIAPEVSMPQRIASYVLSFVALLLFCLRIPDIVSFILHIHTENRYYLRYRSDVKLRISISLWISIALNLAYALFQMGLGLWHHSAYFYAMAGYYALLCGMRLMLARTIRDHAPGEQQVREWRKYRLCGVWLLVMTLALMVFILYFVYRIRDFHHHEITTIAMAAYTFTALTLAIINLIRYQKYRSPAYSAAKVLSLVSATVSLLTLENAMLTTFGQEGDEQTRQTMLRLTGAAVLLFVFILASRMIILSSRRLHPVIHKNQPERGNPHEQQAE